MPRYTLLVEYVDDEGDLMTDDVIVEADDANDAQTRLLDDVTGFLDDADEDANDACVLAVQEAGG